MQGRRWNWVGRSIKSDSTFKSKGANMNGSNMLTGRCPVLRLFSPLMFLLRNQQKSTGNQSGRCLGPLLTLSTLFIFAVGESAAVTSVLGAARLDHSCQGFSGRWNIGLKTHRALFISCMASWQPVGIFFYFLRAHERCGSNYQSLPILLWLFLKSLKRFGSSRLGVLDQSLQDICLLLLFPYCPWVDILCKPQNAEACKSLINADRLSRNGVQDSLSSGGASRAVI